MRRWNYKTDKAGKPRRFLNHGEAALWALLTVGKFLGALALFALLGSIVGSYRDGGPWQLQFTLVLAAVWLAIWLGVSTVIFLYVALSGGVMDDEARRRYRNNETLRSR